MKFNKKRQTLFLDPHSVYGNIESKINIVLSPSLYWVKKISLPVKSVREVKQLLPSIFEDILPEGNYSYSAYKSEDEFIVFAYNDKLILETLSQKNIPVSNVAKIYFAQSEIADIDGALKINESQSIYIKDSLLILVPCCWIEEKGVLDLSKIQHSKHTISLAQFGHIVESKSLYKIGAIAMVLILLLGIEIFITTQKTSAVLAIKDELFEKNSLKSTTFQNKALLKKYKSIYKTQTKIRENISYVLGLKLKNNVKISRLSVKNKKILISFNGVKEGTQTYITKALKSKGMVFKMSFAKEIMNLEVSL